MEVEERKRGTVKGNKEFGGYKYAHYLDCGAGFMRVLIYKTYPIVHFRYVWFVACQAYLA